MTGQRKIRGVVGLLLLFAVGVMTGCATTPADSLPKAEPAPRLHHVVLVWLKNSADQASIQQYIEASQTLAKLPGVVSYEVGVPAKLPQRRASKALDESYDVAVTAVFESQQAFAEFLKNPDYARVAQGMLRPLVDTYRVYDFLVP